MSRIDDFQKKHEYALTVIDQYRTDIDLGRFTDWLLNVDTSIGDLFGRDWYVADTSAQAFTSLLDVLDNAIHDDGEISFIKYNEFPMTVFCDHRSEHFNEAVDRLWNGKPRTIEVLKITTLDEFIGVFHEWRINAIKRWFIFDAVAHGVEFAADHYSHKYKEFDLAWVEQLMPVINFRKNALQS